MRNKESEIERGRKEREKVGREREKERRAERGGENTLSVSLMT